MPFPTIPNGKFRSPSAVQTVNVSNAAFEYDINYGFRVYDDLAIKNVIIRPTLDYALGHRDLGSFQLRVNGCLQYEAPFAHLIDEFVRQNPVLGLIEMQVRLMERVDQEQDPVRREWYAGRLSCNDAMTAHAANLTMPKPGGSLTVPINARPNDQIEFYGPMPHPLPRVILHALKQSPR